MAAKLSTGTQQTRLIVLLAVLVVVAAWAVIKNLGGSGTGTERTEETVLTYTPRPLPRLQSKQPGSQDLGQEAFSRNPFTFGPPPTPTRNLTPPATRIPPPIRTPRPTPTPRYVLGEDGERLPPPPPFDREYIGFLGPSRLSVAVFRKNNEIEVVPIGNTIDDTFIVREIGLESVQIGFVGYPEKETTRVPVAQN